MTRKGTAVVVVVAVAVLIFLLALARSCREGSEVPAEEARTSKMSEIPYA